MSVPLPWLDIFESDKLLCMRPDVPLMRAEISEDTSGCAIVTMRRSRFWSRTIDVRRCGPVAT